MIPDSVIFGSEFGAADPYNYVEAGQATENIKALLEGAFEDEEEKPRTRGRKKKVEAAVANLTDELKDLGVQADQKAETKEEIDEDEDKLDDGTVEGLKVKLLPHQVDGVDWMREKETGVKKKNGVLPKGGILADDVSCLFRSCRLSLTFGRWDLGRLFSPLHLCLPIPDLRYLPALRRTKRRYPTRWGRELS